MSGLAGTEPYMAPEMVRLDAYSHCVDVWSLGVCLFTLLSGYLPFDPHGTAPPRLVQRGEKGDGNFCRLTGAGYVAPKKADYSHALSLDCEVLLLVFETFGGFSPGVVRFLKKLYPREWRA